MSRRLRSTPTVYPVTAPPRLIRNAAIEIATNIGVPIEFATTSLLIAAAVVCQDKAKVRTKEGHEIPLSLSAVFVGGSGERKSPALNIAIKALQERDERVAADYKLALAHYEVINGAWSVVQDGLRSKLRLAVKKGFSHDLVSEITQELNEHTRAKPTKPRMRRLLVSDISKRALIEALEGINESVAWMTDEGEVALNSPLSAAFGTLNLAWDGSTLSLDRAHDTIVARQPKVSTLVGTQSEVLDQYLKEHGEVARGSGFFARCLFTWPNSNVGTRFETGAKQTWHHVEVFHSRMREILEEPSSNKVDDNPSLKVLEFDRDAFDSFVRRSNEIEVSQAPGGFLSDVTDFAAKTMTNVVRIAGIFEYFSGGPGAVTLDTFERAFSVGWYHLSEAKRIFSDEPKLTELQEDCARLEDYLLDKYRSGLAALRRRDVLRNGPIRNKVRFDTAIQHLVASGKIWIGRDQHGITHIYLIVGYFSGHPAP